MSAPFAPEQEARVREIALAAYAEERERERIESRRRDDEARRAEWLSYTPHEREMYASLYGPEIRLPADRPVSGASGR